MTATALSDSELELRAQLMDAFAQDPELFFADALQVKTLPVAESPLVVDGLWKGERELLAALNRSIAENRPIYIGSGHALGKDFITGGLPLWWQSTRYPAKTILTGPTSRQVHEITWNELERHVTRWNPTLPPLGGRLLKNKYEWDAEHFILPFTTGESHQHIGKAQGFHSPHMLIIVTEAQAVANSVKEQLDGLTTSGCVLFIAIGNPLVTSGWFAQGLRDNLHNIVINLDCEDSPNVLEGREIIPGLVSRAWVEDKRRRWYGQDPEHPLWLSKVKGQLPRNTVENVFSMQMISAGLAHTPIWSSTRRALGVDVAEFGDDDSAFNAMESGIEQEAQQTSKHEPTDTAGRANAMRVRNKSTVVVVDTIGVGSGVGSMLREMQEEGWSVHSFNGADKPVNPLSEYANRRAELWFYGREQLLLGKVQPPADLVAQEELCEVKYFYTRKGKIQLEANEDVKERLGRSPDRAYAWLLAVWGLQHAEDAQDRPSRVGSSAGRTARPYMVA